MSQAPFDFQALQDEVLLAALPNIVFDGWSMAALFDGALSAGMTRFDVARAFPAGEAEAVAHFADWADRRMLAGLAEYDLRSMKVRARAHAAVRARLEALAPYKEAVRRAIAFSAMPVHCALGPKTLYATVDAIWFAIGDESTDFNFYTKRALLAAVVASTTLYWLEDSSEEHDETWAFLDRALDGALGFGRAAGGFGQSFGKVAALLNNLPSPARFVRRLREAGGAPGAAMRAAADQPGHPSA